MTCDVFKFFKFNEFKLEQLENILYIVETLDVFKVDKSNEFKLEQPENI